MENSVLKRTRWGRKYSKEMFVYQIQKQRLKKNNLIMKKYIKCVGFCINSISVKNVVNKLAVGFGPLRHIEMQIFKSALTIPLLLLIRNLIARAHIHTTHQHILKIFVK